MHHKKFLYIGSHIEVIKYMINKKLLIECIAIPKIAQEKFNRNQISFTVFNTKEDLLQIIHNTDFDVLLSNGCPYILPVNNIKKSHQIFVNIHPSILPMFKGLHPINGAKLFGKEGGATCHIMDDTVDSGNIIAQVSIGETKNIPLPLLYQLSFMAEVEVFKKSLSLKFQPQITQKKEEGFFFNRTDKERCFSFSVNSPKEIASKVYAFNLQNQYAFFIHKNKRLFVRSVCKINNDFLAQQYNDRKKYSIVLLYEDFILIKHHDCFLELQLIDKEHHLKLYEILED